MKSTLQLGTTLGAAVLLFALAPSSLVAADPPGREFTGTAVVNTAVGTRSMPLTLVANRYASEGEVQQLADVLATGGQSALLGAIRYRNDGQLNLGADVRPISLVFAEETKNGYRIVFLTARRIDISEKQLGKESLEYPFGIAEISIDGFTGKGEGNLHVEAALTIDPSGHIDIIDYDGQDGTFRDLRRVR
jgi:hypothetical protein